MTLMQLLFSHSQILSIYSSDGSNPHVPTQTDYLKTHMDISIHLYWSQYAWKHLSRKTKNSFKHDRAQRKSNETL